jgi:hypothetical protein
MPDLKGPNVPEIVAVPFETVFTDSMNEPTTSIGLLFTGVATTWTE